MTIQAYRTQPYETTHENRIFDALLRELEIVWGDEEDLVILLGNFYCNNCEIDAAILKRSSITVIDFKDYGGKISFSENGSWFADKVEVKGGSKPNPFIQIKENKFALLNSLKAIDLPSGRQPDLGHISGLALFHKPIVFEDSQLPPKIESWFHVVDFDRAVERLSQITSRKINLSNRDLKFIASNFSIPEYTPVGSRIKINLETEKNTNQLELPESLQSVMSEISDFLNSSEQILIVTGAIGTGLKQLLKAISNFALARDRNSSILVPSSPIASQYEIEAKSIYASIYSANPTIEPETDETGHNRGLICFDLIQNNDSQQHIYVVGEAHLVSTSFFQRDIKRYGSGKLLTDLLKFINFRESQQQIIFLGDLFQMTRDKPEQSAIFAEHLQAITGLKVKKISIDYIFPGKEKDLFVSNSLEIAKSISKKEFDRLYITTDGLRCIEAPTEKSEKHQLLRKEFTEAPTSTKFVAYNHEAVNRINNWIRQRVFGRGEKISAGDIVEIHNSFSVKNKDELEPSIYVSRGSFAEIVAVNDNIKPLVQPLNGRNRPIIVPFLDIRARLLENNQEIEFLCLKKFLYEEKPEVDRDTLLALYVSAKARFRQKYHKKHDVKNIEQFDNSNSPQLAQFLQKDPYFNAVRLRFGYALTLHRAQGRQFSTVIATMDTGEGQTNETYFRWVYTLFAVVRDRLILSKIPSITPFYKTIWDDSKGKLDSIVPRDLIAFDRDAEAGITDIPEFSISEKALRNLYWHILDKLKPQGINVKSYKHHTYQEIYGFEREDDRSSCYLRLYYNGKFKVTRIETVESDPSEFANQVRDAIVSNLRLETKPQKKIYNFIKGKLDPHKISILAVEHHNFQEVYYLKSEKGEIKLQIFYDKGDRITQIAPLAYSTLEIVEEVRLAMEL